MLRSIRRFFSDPVFAKKKVFLKSLALFEDLGDRDLGYILQALHTRTYHEGESLFLENDIGRALFILETGRVELVKNDAQGKPQRLTMLEPGDFFGEMALLEHLPRSASAIALESSVVHLLYKSKLEALVSAHQRIGTCIMKHLAQILSARLRKTTQTLTLGELEVPRREARHLAG